MFVIAVPYQQMVKIQYISYAAILNPLNKRVISNGRLYCLILHTNDFSTLINTVSWNSPSCTNEIPRAWEMYLIYEFVIFKKQKVFQIQRYAINKGQYLFNSQFSH